MSCVQAQTTKAMGMSQEAYPELISSCVSLQYPFVPQFSQSLLGVVFSQRLVSRKAGLSSALQVGSQPSALLPAPAGHQLPARVGKGALVTEARSAPLCLTMLVEVIG